jgi:hypothetical protein
MTRRARRDVIQPEALRVFQRARRALTRVAEGRTDLLVARVVVRDGGEEAVEDSRVRFQVTVEE